MKARISPFQFAAIEPRIRKKDELVSCGRAVKNHEIRILDENGQSLPERRVGEIVFRGASVTPGDLENPEASGQLLMGGWLHTGDLGFVHKGDLYISGRQKDLVIINGKNYPPQAIEWVVEEIAGIRKGSVVAFSVDGDSTEKLIVIAETTMPENAELAQAISEQVRSAFALTVEKVVLVRRGSVPKHQAESCSAGERRRCSKMGCSETRMSVRMSCRRRSSEPPLIKSSVFNTYQPQILPVGLKIP